MSRPDDETTSWPTLVSVVIPARNAEAVLGQQLAALSRQDYGGAWEVVVVDDNSQDRTAQVAATAGRRLPGFRVLRARGRGTSHARNTGAASCAGDFLVFCDADDVAAPTWLRAMVEAGRGADLVGGYLDFEALNPPRARSSREPNPDDRLPVTMDFLPYAVSSCLGVRTQVFTALDGFNETYRGGAAEDVEFCWRAQLASYRLVFAPDAVMHYRLRSGLWPMAQQAFRYGRGDAQLFRDFREHGIPPIAFGEAAARWGRMVRRLPALLSPDRAARWTFGSAFRLGRLVGSLVYRVPCL